MRKAEGGNSRFYLISLHDPGLSVQGISEGYLFVVDSSAAIALIDRRHPRNWIMIVIING